MTQAAQTTESPQAEQVVGPIPLRVLLIEDNLVDARLIQIMVSDAGANAFDIERADRLGTALERLAKEHFDLVCWIYRCRIPMAWAQFARVHQQFPGVPIIVMSGLRRRARSRDRRALRARRIIS
jgi:CheY-like chemotaxis protein